MNKDMGVAETCREYLRMLLRAVTVFYILMVAGIMPFYYKRETALSAPISLPFFRNGAF